jgi:hypothetical protein
MKWKFKKDAEPQGSSDGFWYDLVDGGYINPDEVLADEEQLKRVKEAINVLSSFQSALEANDLLNEF